MADNLRILAISDVQGNLDAFGQLYASEKGVVDIIIHTGNFGFWDKDTINSDKDNSFLKQIVAFSEVLKKKVVNELNSLSTIGSLDSPESVSVSSGGVDPTSATFAGGAAPRTATDTHTKSHSSTTPTFAVPTTSPTAATDVLKSKLLSGSNNISQLEAYLSGSFKFPCPVYTIFGPLDDPSVIHKFQTGEYHIPNLYLIDHTKCYEIPSPLADQPNIKLYGIGGTLKIHSLFDHGNLDEDFAELCGKVGDLWISMIQIATMYHNVMSFNETRKGSNNTISIFVSHAPIMKTPLLEHLAILTNADFSISQGLHFRYPVMGNGMSFVDSMGGSAGYIDSYRSKFSRLRMILGELWLIVKNEMLELLEESTEEKKEEFKKLMELGLSLFDKIPVSINDSTEKIIPLTLFDQAAGGSGTAGSSSTSGVSTDEDNKKVLKKINDMYFSAYYNLWHFNLCDLVTTQPNSDEQSDYNIMIFDLDKSSNFKLDYCTSQGFNFNFKVDGRRMGKKRFAYEIDVDEDYFEGEGEAEAGARGTEHDAAGLGVKEAEKEEEDEDEEEEEVEEVEVEVKQPGGDAYHEYETEAHRKKETDAVMEDPEVVTEDTAREEGDSTKGNYRGSKFNPNFRSRPGRGRGRGRSRGRSRGNFRSRGN